MAQRYFSEYLSVTFNVAQFGNISHIAALPLLCYCETIMKAPLSAYAKRILSDPEARERLRNFLIAKKIATRSPQKGADWIKNKKENPLRREKPQAIL